MRTRTSVARWPASSSTREQRLHAMRVGYAVLSASNQALLVAQYGPVPVGVRQLAWGEVVHRLALLTVDMAPGEDHVGVVAAGSRQRAELLEEPPPVGARHVVDGAAGENEIERPAQRQRRQRRAHPRS